MGNHPRSGWFILNFLFGKRLQKGNADTPRRWSEYRAVKFNDPDDYAVFV